MFFELIESPVAQELFELLGQVGSAEVEFVVQSPIPAVLLPVLHSGDGIPSSTADRETLGSSRTREKALRVVGVAVQVVHLVRRSREAQPASEMPRHSKSQITCVKPGRCVEEGEQTARQV